MQPRLVFVRLLLQDVCGEEPMRRLVTTIGSIALVAGLAACRPESSSEITADPPPAVPVVVVTPSPSDAPSPSAPASPSKPPAPSPSVAPKPACKTGKYQREVEQALAAMGNFGKVIVDGQQSDTDCAAIKKFQSRFGLRPVDGNPGPSTHNVAQRLRASDPSRCNAGTALTACIDLTHQTTWLMRDGKVIHGPTVTRTGYDHPDGKGAPTPSGSYKIIERQRSNYTETFDVYLHYWQRIMGNNGFHETTSYIHNMAAGSHGCVNLLRSDAIAYWNTLKVGTPVKVFGRRPGT